MQVNLKLKQQQHWITDAIRRSPLEPSHKKLLLQMLAHTLEQTLRGRTPAGDDLQIVCQFGVADLAYCLKTARSALQQTLQYAEAVGLVSLEPILYFKSEFLLRWTPEYAVSQPRQQHDITRASNQHTDEAECEQPAMDEAEPPPQHWKGRPPRRLWRQLRQAVLTRDERTCHYCGTRSGKMTCDHVILVSKGGSSTLDNLVTACLACNSAKATKTPDEWAQTPTHQPKRKVR
jgi:hypothetical protein